MAEIEWVNHASFIVRSNGYSLICDPWLYGAAFNYGWELLVPSTHTVDDLADMNAIWISHVHPDHFAPGVLKAVPKQKRRNVPVYFQKTTDQQVAKFCQGVGYPVTEVADCKTVELAPDFRITVGRVPFYDSWIFIETPEARILNLNDCVLNRPQDLRRVAKRVGQVDVLLTQFSYANWVGGPGDTALREQAAAEKVEWMAAQLEAIKPKVCIPFASYVIFAHVENSYLNDRRNTVAQAVATIEKAGVAPVVLYPGDRWTVGSPHNPRTAMARYEKSWDTALREQITSPPASWEELTHLATACAKRLGKHNNRILLRVAARLGVGAPLLVRIPDLGRTARFDPLRGLSEVDPATEPDITLSSQSFAYTLKFDWGADTLSVNGRFRATPAGYRKMLRSFGPSLLNNNGRALAFRLLADPWLVRRAIDRFVLRAS